MCVCVSVNLCAYFVCVHVCAAVLKLVREKKKSTKTQHVKTDDCLNKGENIPVPISVIDNLLL